MKRRSSGCREYGAGHRESGGSEVLGTVFQKCGGLLVGAMALASAAVLLASSRCALAEVTATGGSVTNDGWFQIHTFTNTAATEDFVVSGGSLHCEVLVVAGGGSGGSANAGNGGGGGAGGLIYDDL
ncbi:MAG: hypothetical protein PHR35_20515, partial [Kiritimatiellae bacterium]|nr:hypothetical protein [Kiritimatiellia bacterium]